MGIYEKGLITVLGCGLVSVLIAIPLALRRVPRNIIYGYRTRATLSDDYTWYEANAFFGRVFLISNIVSAVAFLLLYGSQCLSPVLFLNASVVALIAPSIVAAIATVRFVRTLTKDASSSKQKD